MCLEKSRNFFLFNISYRLPKQKRFHSNKDNPLFSCFFALHFFFFLLLFLDSIFIFYIFFAVD